MTHRAETGVTAVTTPTDRAVAITRVVDAPRPVVFDAWTNPEQLQKWLLGPDGWTMPVCEVDPRPGGRWRYVWRKSDGTEMEMGGAFREVVAPERTMTTEKWGPEWPETVNTLVLTESGGRTTMTLTITYPTKDARDAALATGMKEGIDQSYDRLDAVLASMA